MFPVVIAPPIVYSAAALVQLYVRSSGLHDKKVVFDAAANYRVYGFPAHRLGHRGSADQSPASG